MLSNASTNVRPKAVIEYPLPGAWQTHEIVTVDNESMALISQQTNSSLVKMALSPEGVPQAAAQHPIGHTRSGLHGLTASKVHPGKIWATKQFDNSLVLIDPVGPDVSQAPVVVQEISLPAPARGPHGVIEVGDNLWVTAKDSCHVVRINHQLPDDFTLYPAQRSPIFVARHEKSGDMYASQAHSNLILRIPANGGQPEQIPIPPGHSMMPVGLIAGPDGNVWFTLTGGGTSGGAGQFGKIAADGQIQMFQLTTDLGQKASLLHLAFDTGTTPDTISDVPADKLSDIPSDKAPALWLLASSIAVPQAMDALFMVTLDSTYSSIGIQSATVFPTQSSKVHRVLVLRHCALVTELAVSIVAHIPKRPIDSQGRLDEAADYYSDFGLGIEGEQVTYDPLFAQPAR